jgi:predicted Zn-dependent peptidase
MGSNHDNYLTLAVNYLPYLGTDKYTAAELQQEFFKNGLSFDVFTSTDRTRIYLSGLEANLEKGVELMEHILSSVQVDMKAYKELVEGILKEREDNKTNKSYILNSAMASYARYGAVSPFTDIIPAGELKNLNPQLLIDKIKSLSTFQHRMFYYGQRPLEQVSAVINTYHKVGGTLQDYPQAEKYPELATEQTKVYVVDYDMVQAQILFMSKDQSFTPALLPAARLFNEYFGSGLSSIVFQEIRETKALAYSAYASFGTPLNKEDAHYVRAFVGTQADKMKQSVEAMLAIMNEMPQAQQQFDASVESVAKQIESERIIRSGIFWTYEDVKRKGLNHDYRRDVYNHVKGMTMDELQEFFDQHIADRNYTILVLGDKEMLDMAYLQSLGEVKELSLTDIFGY